MIIAPAELNTELYPEIIDEICRNDPQEVVQHIKDAEDFVKGYLFKYDLNALFGNENSAPTVQDNQLKKVIKFIASYFLVRKANPNINLELFREDWLMLVGGGEHKGGWLEGVRDGLINPPWPYQQDNPLTPENESNADVWHTSNYKRSNSF